MLACMCAHTHTHTHTKNKYACMCTHTHTHTYTHTHRFTSWLSLGVPGVDVHGEVKASTYSLQRLPTELVGLVDALGVPVRPVQLVLKQRQRKRMGQT